VKSSSVAAAELALAALYLEPTSARQAALVDAARCLGAGGEESALNNGSGLGERLESHGVLPLVSRNLAAAGVNLPAPRAAAWSGRTTAQREDARRFGLTLETSLAALNEAGIRPVLLKGASLGLDLYPEQALRGMGDLDLLIEPSELGRALGASAQAGLVMGESSFPVWWYRRAHFHLKLLPTSSLLREVEVHWALHHPSLLLTVQPADLRRRCVPVLDGRAWTLAPEDRLLHLITHLASHAYGARSASRADLLRVILDPLHPLRLKWLLDVHAEVERLHAVLTPASFRARIDEWSAAGEVRWVLEWIDTALGFEAAAAGWVRELLGPRRTARPRTDATPAHTGPLASFEFRAETLGRFPRWVWPPAGVLERRTGGASAVHRWAHAAGILGRAALVGGSLPGAYLGRWFLRAGRRRAALAARTPERILDQAVALRSLERKSRAA